MFKIGDKEYSDNDVAQTYWETVKDRMDCCRKIAEESFNQMHRDSFYRLDYSVDPGKETIYVKLPEKDYDIIKKAIEEDQAVNGVFENYDDRTTFFMSEAFYLDIDWRDYIPEEDWSWAGGEPVILDVDLDDVKYFCAFKVTHIKGGDENQKETYKRNIYLKDEEYINLLTLRLFDPRLCFSDLSILLPDLYERIDKEVRRVHCDYFVELKEINDLARSLMESSKEYKELPDYSTNIFSPIIVHTILSQKEIFAADDDLLFKAFRIYNM